MPVAGSLVALAGAAALCGTGPLDILLTNDDGSDATGIRALRTQLIAAGHRVTLAAPDHNASGTAMSFDWGPVRLTPDPDDAGVYAISGSPATSVALAANVLYEQGRGPDLIVSGINQGPNSGALLVLSGTVGAALAGTLLLDPPVPGSAVTAPRLKPDEPVDSPANRAQFDAVASHFTGLVAATRGWFCTDGAVTRNRNVLNVNYPARPAAELRGTVVATQGTTSGLRIRYVGSGAGEYRAEVQRSEADDARGSDNHWLELGYVTVTPVSGVIDDESAPRKDLERRLRRR
jgi:5'-nucleotidase